MGGSGSGRHGNRPIVEYGLKLDSYMLQRQGFLSTRGYGFVDRPLSWKNSRTGKCTFSIGLGVNYENGQMTLDYRCTAQGKDHQVKESFSLYRQKTSFGGSRFLFVCRGCERRTAKLYLPSGGIYFRCRRCYNLTYLSSNDSHKGDAFLAHIALQAGLPFSQVKRMLKPR